MNPDSITASLDKTRTMLESYRRLVEVLRRTRSLDACEVLHDCAHMASEFLDLVIRSRRVGVIDSDAWRDALQLIEALLALDDEITDLVADLVPVDVLPQQRMLN